MVVYCATGCWVFSSYRKADLLQGTRFMNITAFIFFFVFLLCLGNVTGKLFKNMNPFLVMIGLVLLLGFFPMIDQQDNMLFFVAFALGFLENFRCDLASSRNCCRSRNATKAPVG